MGKLQFCEHFVHLGKDLISFQDRPYLPAVYRCKKRNLVLRCSRQTEKSTFLANSILYEACTNPGIAMLLVAPRLEQAWTFCHSRLLPCLHDSPLIRRILIGSQYPPALHHEYDFRQRLAAFRACGFPYRRHLPRPECSPLVH